MQEQVNKIFELWSSNLRLPTIGPTYAFSKDFGSFANDFVTLGKALIELKSNMDSYWSLISAAYTRAMRNTRSEEHTSELQSRQYLVCRLLLEKKKKKYIK